MSTHKQHLPLSDNEFRDYRSQYEIQKAFMDKLPEMTKPLSFIKLIEGTFMIALQAVDVRSEGGILLPEGAVQEMLGQLPPFNTVVAVGGDYSDENSLLQPFDNVVLQDDNAQAINILMYKNVRFGIYYTASISGIIKKGVEDKVSVNYNPDIDPTRLKIAEDKINELPVD